MVAIFSKAHALTSRKYVSKLDINVPNSSDHLNFFWSHPSIFALETQSKNLDFQRFFTSKTSFGGYFNNSGKKKT